MKPFTRQETLIVTAILIFTFTITFYNLNISLRRARDAQRRADIGAITNALNKYRDDFGFSPPSLNGKIVACKGENFEQRYEELKDEIELNTRIFFELLVPCEWGKDALTDVTDDTYEPYLKNIPQDPEAVKGMSYLYLSNSNRFQVLTFMEGKDEEIGYDEAVVQRNLECGAGYICSFGKSYASPLDRSIEDYEKELLEKARSGGG